MTHGTHLAGEPDLAEEHRGRRCRMTEFGGDDRRRHCQVCRWLLHPQATGDVEINVARAHHKTAARLEHGQQHGQPAAVPADDGPARRGQSAGCDQGLDLDQQRAAALHAGEDGGARHALFAVGQEQGGGIGHRHQARFGHLEHADLVGGAEAVLDRAQDPELVATLALEVEHGVDHVLEHARAGDLTVLGDMADQQQGTAALLGEADQRLGGGAQLGDGARRLLEPVDPHGLDGIDDHQVRRLRAVDRGQHVAGRGRAGQLDGGVSEAEPKGAQPDLVDQFLAADIDDRAALDGQGSCRLQHQGALADAGVAADEDRRPGDDAAAQHPVELVDAAGQARRRGRGPGQRHELEPPPLRLAAGGRSRACRRLLHQAVPGAAIVAAPRPAWVRGTAALADIGPLRLGHQAPIAAAPIRIGPSARPWMNWST